MSLLLQAGTGLQDDVDATGRDVSESLQSATVTQSQTSFPKKSAGPPDLAQTLAFSGPAPERINGRLAMLGIVAAIAAEVATGAPVSVQLGKTPLLIAGTFLTFIVASVVSLAHFTDLSFQSSIDDMSEA